MHIDVHDGICLFYAHCDMPVIRNKWSKSSNSLTASEVHMLSAYATKICLK